MAFVLSPSVQSFLSRDPKNMMYAKPWRKLLAEQNRRFKAQWRADHPSFECRWQLHKLAQCQYVETMADYHAGASQDERTRLWIRQKAEYEAMSAALWNAVKFAPERDRRAA